MIQRYSLYFAWVLAGIGTLGSLFFSEILNHEPCHLCWLQRISLFPLAIILGIGAYFGDGRSIRYALPLATIGLVIAFYQIAIQEIPSLSVIEVCGKGPPCSQKTLIGFGFITIPMLSALDFLSIIGLLFLAKRMKPPNSTPV